MTDSMIDAKADLPSVPFSRPDVLTLAPAVRLLQDEAAVSRIRTAVGDEAWMVTRAAAVRSLLMDHKRLGWSPPEPENAAKVTNSALLDNSAGGFGDGYDADALMRSVLSGSFSAKRMRLLEERIGGLVDELLTAMEAAPPPVDLVTSLAEPLPVLVICELLGVPYADRARFREWSTAVADLYDAERSGAALAALQEYMTGLMENKAADPAADVLSDLARAADDGVLRYPDAALIATGLLFAGHHTTMVAIEAGALRLLVNPDQRAALLADPGLLGTAVEEILRLGIAGGENFARYATEDFEIGGVTVRRGDAVVINTVAANRDPREFAEPERFDITRKPNPHVSFGHGRHMCIGMSLARVELRAVFSRLFDRFPGMRLAGEVRDLREHEQQVSGGLVELPVTW